MSSVKMMLYKLVISCTIYRFQLQECIAAKLKLDTDIHWCAQLYCHQWFHRRYSFRTHFKKTY